jgi:hypothetical protein
MPTLLIYICGALLLVKVVFHLLMFDGKQSRADLAIGVKLAIGLLARSSMPNLCFDNPYASLNRLYSIETCRVKISSDSIKQAIGTLAQAFRKAKTMSEIYMSLSTLSWRPAVFSTPASPHH